MLSLLTEWQTFLILIAINSVSCSVIRQDLQPETNLLNFLGFMENFPACRPGACKIFQQSQLGNRLTRILYQRKKVIGRE